MNKFEKILIESGESYKIFAAARDKRMEAKCKKQEAEMQEWNDAQAQAPELPE